MGQAQLGGMGALPGYGGSSFGGANGTQAGLTGAVKGATGALTEYNPQTMSETTKAAPPSTAPEFTAAGMDSTSGMPSYVTNWLQSGGTGTMPTSTGIMPASPVAQSQAGDLFKPQGAAKRAMPAKEAFVAPPPKVATKTATPAAGAGAGGIDPSGLTLIPMNAAGGYNQPGLQQPMAVSDQWNGLQGGSNQIASPPVGGGQNAPQMMSKGIYTDNKGNYFSKDASGKIVPISGNIGGGPGGQSMADYTKKFFQGWGYA
jgi:hypothetical protein